MLQALRLHDTPDTGARPHLQASCVAVQFYGSELHVALSAAAEYLLGWEVQHGCSPSVVALHDEFSWEDAGGDIAWQLTLVLRDEAEAGR